MKRYASHVSHRGLIPARAGIGLRAEHYEAVLERLPDLGWLEVHSENYFGGGPPLGYLEQIRSHYPLSLHGVGLSLGATDPVNGRHLQKLKSLIRRFEPGLVSEHLCWSSVAGQYLNDLLPLPYTEEALAHVAERIIRVQEYLGRTILIENLSSYLEYTHSTLAEWEFLTEVARRSGCGILLDINNIYVSAHNHGFDPQTYVAHIPPQLVQEIHLAGFSINRYETDGRCDGEILIDTHDKPVTDAVWNLYAWSVQSLGQKPTLIEWDTDLPSLDILLGEAAHADRLSGTSHDLAA